jgi:four helix bundle protein
MPEYGLDVRHVASSKGHAGHEVVGLHPDHLSLSRGWNMQRFTDLKVWQRSHALTLEVYRVTSSFPDHERFGLVSQLRRAASSVPTNIAEGSKRARNQDYARFLNIAESSTAEMEYLVILVRDLGYIGPDVSVPLLREADEIARMLHALRTKVEQET